MESPAQTPHEPAQDRLLDTLLRDFLGPVDEAGLAALRGQLEWLELPAGQTLMRQGEPGDAMYLCVSGRLRAYAQVEDGSGERLLRDMGRGQVVGEMALYTEAPRSATVVAVRDSVLVRLSKPRFLALLAGSAAASVALTRQLIQRLQTPPRAPQSERPVVTALVPVTAGVDAGALASELAAALAPLLPQGRVAVLDAAAVDRALGAPGLTRTATGQGDADRRIAHWLEQQEAAHDALLLVADAEPTPWTERCCRRSDELLLLADATQAPVLHASEHAFLMRGRARAEAAEVLVLLHPPGTRNPSHTAAWLDRRPLADHVHLRRGLARDVARLARLQARQAVGLVLAGGGARGLAHLGVVHELAERGVEIDVVAGTSIGSVMAAMVAFDRPLDELTAIARRGFKTNPTGDFNWVPLHALIRGTRLKRVFRRAIDEIFEPGAQPQIEDLWKGFACVASNYSQAREEVLRRGPLVQALQASTAIPGALPPVVRDGDLLCDGGTFNNFPVDVLRGLRGVGRVIGVDLSARKPRRIEAPELPGTLALLRDRLRPRAKRRYRFPSLTSYLLNVTILYSSSRQAASRAQTDLYLNPPLERVGMLQWHRFDSIVAQGRAYAAQVLDGLEPAQRRLLGLSVSGATAHTRGQP